jgi:hypothetical protein
MKNLRRTSRGFGVALAALALTAGVAFASAGPGTIHLDLAGAHGATVNGDQDESEAPESEAPESDAPESEAPESEAPESEAPESEAPDSEAPDASGAPADTHGGLVSTAAQMSTPPDFTNHGAFVSCIARMHRATLTGFDWSAVTAAACQASRHGGRRGGH